MIGQFKIDRLNHDGVNRVARKSAEMSLCVRNDSWLHGQSGQCGPEGPLPPRRSKIALKSQLQCVDTSGVTGFAFENPPDRDPREVEVRGPPLKDWIYEESPLRRELAFSLELGGFPRWLTAEVRKNMKEQIEFLELDDQLIWQIPLGIVAALLYA